MQFVAQLKTWQLILIGIILPIPIFIVFILILSLLKLPINDRSAALFLKSVFEYFPLLWFFSVCKFIEKYVKIMEKQSIIHLFKVSNICILIISTLISFIFPFIDKDVKYLYFIPIYLVFISSYFFSAYITSIVISKHENVLRKRSYLKTLFCLIIFPLNIFVIPNKLRTLFLQSKSIT